MLPDVTKCAGYLTEIQEGCDGIQQLARLDLDTSLLSEDSSFERKEFLSVWSCKYWIVCRNLYWHLLVEELCTDREQRLNSGGKSANWTNSHIMIKELSKEHKCVCKSKLVCGIVCSCACGKAGALIQDTVCLTHPLKNAPNFMCDAGFKLDVIAR